jgi:diacylglycerol kinase family enzyme
MLEKASVKYKEFVTDSPTFIDEWVTKLNFQEMPYTEFVIIGGDGLLSQYLNAVGNHKEKDAIFKMPIGVVPGGSHNATACDLNGTNPYMACTNILKGVTIQANILKVKLKNQNLSLYTSAIAWGIVSDIVKASQGCRK